MKIISKEWLQSFIERSFVNGLVLLEEYSVVSGKINYDIADVLQNFCIKLSTSNNIDVKRFVESLGVSMRKKIFDEYYDLVIATLLLFDCEALVTELSRLGLDLSKNCRFICGDEYCQVSPVYLAATLGEIEKMETFLDVGGNMEASCSVCGETPFLASISKLREESVNYFLHNVVGDRNKVQYLSENFTTLMEPHLTSTHSMWISNAMTASVTLTSINPITCTTGVTTGKTSLVSAMNLLNVYAKTVKGRNALMLACKALMPKVLKYLLENFHFDVADTDNEGNSALHYAARYGSNECVELLHEHGAKQSPNIDGYYPSTVAARYNNEKALQLLSAKQSLSLMRQNNFIITMARMYDLQETLGIYVSSKKFKYKVRLEYRRQCCMPYNMFEQICFDVLGFQEPHNGTNLLSMSDAHVLSIVASERYFGSYSRDCEKAIFTNFQRLMNNGTNRYKECVAGKRLKDSTTINSWNSAFTLLFVMLSASSDDVDNTLSGSCEKKYFINKKLRKMIKTLEFYLYKEHLLPPLQRDEYEHILPLLNVKKFDENTVDIREAISNVNCKNLETFIETLLNVTTLLLKLATWLLYYKPAHRTDIAASVIYIYSQLAYFMPDIIDFTTVEFRQFYDECQSNKSEQDGLSRIPLLHTALTKLGENHVALSHPETDNNRIYIVVKKIAIQLFDLGVDPNTLDNSWRTVLDVAKEYSLLYEKLIVWLSNIINPTHILPHPMKRWK